MCETMPPQALDHHATIGGWRDLQICQDL